MVPRLCYVRKRKRSQFAAQPLRRGFKALLLLPMTFVPLFLYIRQQFAPLFFGQTLAARFPALDFLCAVVLGVTVRYPVQVGAIKDRCFSTFIFLRRQTMPFPVHLALTNISVSMDSYELML